MSRRVLLVDTDVDALGALASALRARGITVVNASDAFEAVEQAFRSRPDVVLVDGRLDDDQDLVRAFEIVPELGELPVLRLRADRPSSQRPSDVPRGDVDLLVSRIASASPRVSAAPLEQDLRGNLEQMPMVDLLQLLTMNRRSGVLAVSTSYGAGEVRVTEGEVTDAVYRRLEGEKALFRLLAEREGRFAFSPGEPTTTRRFTAPTSQLLMEAMRNVDEVARRRSELALGAEALLVDDGPLPTDQDPERAQVARDVARLLVLPRILDDLLDEHTATDLAILEAVRSLQTSGRLRRVPIAQLTTPFAPPEQLPVLRSLVTRLTRAGFAPPPRLVIAGTAARLTTLAHTIRRVTDMQAALDTPPTAPLPRALGTLRLGDGVDLAVVGLPTDDIFAPTWTLVLPGVAAVVRLAGAGGQALEAHCEAVEVMLIDAESVMGSLDTTVPAQVAALLRSTLELAAGV
jgi:CheY-like chemotaxis protein